jgi:mRNA interferase MazF
MPYEFGDVVLVSFPFTSQVGSKQRPAVVVSSLSHNSTKPDIVLMAVTSQFRPSATLGEVWLGDWKAAGLLEPSVVKPVFATLLQTIINRQLGTLSASNQTTLKSAIHQILQ